MSGQIHTDWEQIGIANDFLFGKIMRNPGLCKKLLERILPELEIDRIEYPELQKTIREEELCTILRCRRLIPESCLKEAGITKV